MTDHIILLALLIFGAACICAIESCHPEPATPDELQAYYDDTAVLQDLAERHRRDPHNTIPPTFD